MKNITREESKKLEVVTTTTLARARKLACFLPVRLLFVENSVRLTLSQTSGFLVRWTLGVKILSLKNLKEARKRRATGRVLLPHFLNAKIDHGKLFSAERCDAKYRADYVRVINHAVL